MVICCDEDADGCGHENERFVSKDMVKNYGTYCDNCRKFIVINGDLDKAAIRKDGKVVGYNFKPEEGMSELYSTPTPVMPF